MLQTYLLQKGEGPPWVFLHGFLGTHRDFLPLISHLPQRHCIGIDLPGHGEAPFTPHFLEEFPPFPEPIHLVGYSMGGRLAALFAHTYPERVASLTLLSTHLGLKTAQEKEERLKTDALWAKKLLTLPIDLFLSEWYDQPLFAGFRPDLTLRRQHKSPDLTAALLHYSLGNQERLPPPPRTRLFVGERDTKFRTLYPAEIVPNAGHMIHLENPQHLAKLL